VILYLYTLITSYRAFIAYKLKPVCRLSFKGVVVSYIVSLVSILLMGRLVYCFVEPSVSTDAFSGLMKINPLILLYAGVEDFIFVLPLFLLPKRYELAGLVISSVLFTLGHSYQDTAMYGKIASIPVSYLLARRYGIFSTALSHGINDVIAVFLLQHLTKPTL
jgi:membrane protease YdiL (CAAX protease family)